MRKSDFDRLLERYMKSEGTEEERARVEAWLDRVKTKSSLGLTEESELRMFQGLVGKLNLKK